MKLDNFLKYRFIYNKLPIFLLLLVALSSCTITPELDERVDLTPARTQIANPTNLTVKSIYDKNNPPSIELTWDLVNNATYYVVYYQKATDYLSNAEWKKVIVQDPQFTLSSSNFTDSDDMRYVFKVASGVVTTSNAKIESTGTDLKEGAIVNNFTVSQVISDNILKLYSSYPDTQSVLSDGNIVEPEIKYYENGSEDKVIDPSGRELTSAEKLKITAVLYVDGEEITSNEFTVQNSINYIPPALIELNGSKNELNKITLTWKAEDINVGLDSENTKLKFEVLRKKKDSTGDYELIETIDSTDTSYQQRNSDNLIEYYKYEDKALEANTAYTYQVVSYYYTNIDDKEVIFAESKNTRKSVDAYALYNMPKTFTVEKQTGFDEIQTGDATYTVKLNWSYYNNELPENAKVIITRWDFSQTTIVDGTPTDETTTTDEKSQKVYEGRDAGCVDTITLTAEKNEKEQKYVYYMYFLYNDEPLNVMTMAKFADGSDGIVATLPSIQQVNFIKEYSASTDHADGIYISWELDRDAIASAGLDISKVKMSILKRDDSAYLVYQDKITGTSFIDTEIEKGEEYSYILEPYYDDLESPYNGTQSTTEPFKGKTLGEVAEVSATENTYNDRIVVKWNSVADVKGYDIYYKKQGTDTYSKYNTEVINNTTEVSLEGLEAGIDYDIVVGVVDNYGNSAYKESSAVIGSILGTITPTVSTDKSDYIEVKWNEVKNATKYAVKVFSDTTTSTETLYQEVRAGEDTSWSFSSDDILNVATWEYPLSRQYYVTVTPYVNKVSAEPTERTAGNWIMPPKNITATKASYRDLITVSWDAVDGATGYAVYRRKHGSNDEWLYRSTTATTSLDDLLSGSDDTKYEYTILTQKNGLEGAKQNYFESNNNVGYVLAVPNSLVGLDLGNGYFKLSWKRVDGATDYPITINGSSLDSISTQAIDSASSSISTYTDKAITYDQSTGIVDLYLSKDYAPVTTTVYVSFTVSARNSGAAISSKNTTSPVGTQFMYSSLNRSEVANIIAYNLNPIFSSLNSAAGGDWWTGNWESIDGEFGKTKIVSESTISATRAYSSGWNSKIANVGEIKLTSYFINSNYFTGTFECRTEEGNYAKTNPLQKITSSSTLVIQLPGKFPDISVSFSDYYVNNSGSGTISISYNNDSWTLSKLPKGLL